jgi:hypothetical protein
MDSSLAYRISVNHPYYYEQIWGKQYEYILAFSEYGGVEDVTQRYAQSWESVLQRRGNNALSFQERHTFFIHSSRYKYSTNLLTWSIPNLPTSSRN